ncbi:hypothetical protein RFI_28184 [Reticulomyxa filosa]|uniref:Pseudouridine synthase RsuA/RluA-like domain-containing protein n=1 Tax=Reticulomyxa filosa TaxID=46433 RepID=X6M6D6_RETFI|nr:hypothetical protein RFI_28184 [Reticulomyxa filosa]|eukprot:ETO09201.1 hypothetical protein RFI_28184 [Reticulomyxa filosa]
MMIFARTRLLPKALTKCLPSQFSYQTVGKWCVYSSRYWLSYSSSRLQDLKVSLSNKDTKRERQAQKKQEKSKAKKVDEASQSEVPTQSSKTVYTNRSFHERISTRKKQMGLVDVTYKIDIKDYDISRHIIGPNVLYKDNNVIVLHKLPGIVSCVDKRFLPQHETSEKREQAILPDLQSMLREHIKVDKELRETWRFLAQQAIDIAATTKNLHRQPSVSTVTQDHNSPLTKIDKWMIEAKKLNEKYGIDKVEEQEKKDTNVDIVPYVGVLHRLDHMVSGVLLFTRHAQATKEFVELFSQKKIRKYYVAIVKGIPNWNEKSQQCSVRHGVLEHYISKSDHLLKVKVLSKKFVDDLLHQANPSSVQNEKSSSAASDMIHSTTHG